jgi:hypothetical protein
VNLSVVKTVRENLKKINHLSRLALEPEILSLLDVLTSDERQKLRMVAVLVVKNTTLR